MSSYLLVPLRLFALGTQSASVLHFDLYVCLV